MLRGTRVMTGDTARLYTAILMALGAVFVEANYEEVILPSLWEQQTLIDKAGTEIILPDGSLRGQETAPRLPDPQSDRPGARAVARCLVQDRQAKVHILHPALLSLKMITGRPLPRVHPVRHRDHRRCS